MSHSATATSKTAHRTLWTFLITSVALFMVTLDKLVVTTALPVIRTDLHASLSQLEWTVNAYTLTFAVLLLTGAALGDRFGRRLMFSIGLSIFTLASAAAALAPNPTVVKNAIISGAWRVVSNVMRVMPRERAARSVPATSRPPMTGAGRL